MHLQDQSEHWVIFNLLVTDLDAATLLDGESAQQRVQHWVDCLSNVLQQQAVAIGDGLLNGIKIPVPKSS